MAAIFHTSVFNHGPNKQYFIKLTKEYKCKKKGMTGFTMYIITTFIFICTV